MKKVLQYILPISSVIMNIIFFCICLTIFLVGFISTTKNLVLYTTGVEIEAIVEKTYDDDEEKYVMLRYTVDSTVYQAPVSFAFRDLRVGDRVNIWYDANNPVRFLIPGKVFPVTIITLIIGILTLPIFVIKNYRYIKEIVRIKNLYRLNKTITGKIIDAMPAGNKYRVGQMEPIIIKAEYQNKVFTSSIIYFNIDNPTSLVNHFIVIYTSNLENNYYLDINTLHKE